MVLWYKFLSLLLLFLIHGILCSDESIKDLFEAVKRGDIKTVKEVKGNNLVCTDQAGYTILHAAAYYGHFDIVKYLCHEAQVAYQHKKSNDLVLLSDSNFKNGSTPLHLAIIQGHIAVVKYFVENGIYDEIESNYWGNTPLHFAIGNGHREIFKYLLTKYKSNRSNRDGYKALHIAAQRGDLESIKILLESEKICYESTGGNRGFVDFFKSDLDKDLTPLYLATFNRHIPVIEYLLEDERVNVNEVSYGGNTALHFLLLSCSKE